MSLFQYGDFLLHSGGRTNWIIDCRALTDEDLLALAQMAANMLPPFCLVEPIARGGLAFGDALRGHCQPKGSALIVDDVLTTGASMEQRRESLGGGKALGVVIFARGPCASWITPLFRTDA